MRHIVATGPVNAIAYTAQTGLRRTSPVGLFSRSCQKEFGIDDLAGNVWEWCCEEPFAYKGSQKSSGSRGLRGGSWFDSQGVAYADYRNGDHPGNHNFSIGFRLVFAPPFADH